VDPNYIHRLLVKYTKKLLSNFKDILDESDYNILLDFSCVRQVRV